MSKITEYLKLIPRGLPNSSAIIESVINGVQERLGKLPEEEKEEIVRRRVICATCPFMSKNAVTSEEYLSLTGKHYSTKRNDEHCSFCGCGIETRTRALSAECGISTWNDEQPKKTIPLKWDKFNTDGSK